MHLTHATRKKSASNNQRYESTLNYLSPPKTSPPAAAWFGHNHRRNVVWQDAKSQALGKGRREGNGRQKKKVFVSPPGSVFRERRRSFFLARGKRGGRGKRSLLTGPFLILLSQLGTRLSHTPRSPSFFPSSLLTPFIPLLLSSQDDKVKRG